MNRDWSGNSTSIYANHGASNHSVSDRETHDFYATPPEAVEMLCNLEQFNLNILEPCCGTGHISKVLQSRGYNVESRDLVDRGFGIGGCDFLSVDNLEWCGDIITNPPYKYAQEFVEKALDIVPEGNRVAMFLKLTFLEGKSRKNLFKIYPPNLYTYHPLGLIAE